MSQKSLTPRSDNKTQKRSVRRSMSWLAIVVLVALGVLIIPMNIWLQTNWQHRQEENNSAQLFAQVELLIQNNEATIEKEKQDFKDYCIEMADLAAFFAAKDPSVATDLVYSRRLAKKMDVDEIHVFDTTGTIYGGTHPEYYGYSFDSGEQMGFFKPMLKDTSLKLCQEIMPNTAEGKEMQYAAVWTDDASMIVEIGMNPERVQKVIEENSLENLVANLPFDLQGQLHIVDKATMTVKASTVPKLVGNSTEKIQGLDDLIAAGANGHITYEDGRYCVFLEEFGDIVMVRTYLSSYVGSAVVRSTGLTILYIFLIAVAVVGLVMWYTRRKLSNNLNQIMEVVRRVAGGQRESLQLDTGVTELDSLTEQINQLVASWDVDASRWDQELHRLQDERNRDVLTGIYNRRGFHDQLTELLAAPEKIGEAACVVIDADGLKRINDSYSHRAGDALLVALAKHLDSLDPAHTITGRLGGDEFAVFLYGYDRHEEVEAAVEQIRQGRGLLYAHELLPEPAALQFSLGYVYCPEEDHDYRNLLRRADERMYRDKLQRHARQVERTERAAAK